MKIAYFTHSLRSDWNHGNAHFLRGLGRELIARGHEFLPIEPETSWSVTNLVQDRGEGALDAYKAAYPELDPQLYATTVPNLDVLLEDADVVIVHEWNEPELIAAVGKWRVAHPEAVAFFHDTHHRGVTAPEEMARYDLSNYDGVLAFGEILKEIYLERGWSRRAWTIHEAADPSVFKPIDAPKDYDLVWVGNWGDNERTAELHEFLLGPVKRLGLKALVHGVRYPDDAKAALADAGIEYGGYLPNHEAPGLFARARMTVHVPRGPYVRALPGIPTIRPFEAMACAIPLLSSPWSDAEGLFHGENDYATARDGDEMETLMRRVIDQNDEATTRAAHGLTTVLGRHTTGHRADELLRIIDEVRA